MLKAHDVAAGGFVNNLFLYGLSAFLLVQERGFGIGKKLGFTLRVPQHKAPVPRMQRSLLQVGAKIEIHVTSPLQSTRRLERPRAKASRHTTERIVVGLDEPLLVKGRHDRRLRW